MVLQYVFDNHRLQLYVVYSDVVDELWSRDPARERRGATPSGNWSTVWLSVRRQLREHHGRR